jgi:hypothetical protein
MKTGSRKTMELRVTSLLGVEKNDIVNSLQTIFKILKDIQK